LPDYLHHLLFYKSTDPRCCLLSPGVCFLLCVFLFSFVYTIFQWYVLL
jgi:hypothetical protein